MQTIELLRITLIFKQKKDALPRASSTQPNFCYSLITFTDLLSSSVVT